MDRRDARHDADASGCATAASAAIWPGPRIPSSVTTTSVSGSTRNSVSGRPISLLCPCTAATVRATGAQSAARMSFVEVLPTEPVIETTSAPLRPRTSEAEGGERGVLVVRHERGRGAAGECVVDEPGTAAHGDEQRPGGDAAGIRRDRVTRPAGADPELAGSGRAHVVERERDHASTFRSASRATSRSSNGWICAGDLLAELVTLAGDHDDVAGARQLDRPLDRCAAVELDLHLA